MFDSAGKLLLQVLPYVARHVGDNTIRVHESHLQYFGITPDDRRFVFVQITHQLSGKTAFARIYAENDLATDQVALEWHIMENCGADEGDLVALSPWSITEEAIVAKKIDFISDTGGVLFDHELKMISMRLQDSLCPLLEGQSVTVIHNTRGLKLTAIETTPPNQPVIVGPETELIIRDMKLYSTTVQMNDNLVFSDIGGLTIPIQRLRELVLLPLQYPEIFQKFGIRGSKGIILTGPPGSGKTLLARALAKEFKASFHIINGPEILSRFYGATEQRIRDTFETALKNAPSVIFIDEIDSIAPNRERVDGELEKRIVGQLLTLMDGIEERGKIVIIAATNRLNAIDPALRRPGRFDSEIEIFPPNVEERLEILRVHTRDIALDQDVNLYQIATKTNGYVGADLSALCQESALCAIRRIFDTTGVNMNIKPEQQLMVTHIDFLQALKAVQPSAFRFFNQPQITLEWDNIFGMDSLKRELLALLDLPKQYVDKLMSFGVGTQNTILIQGPPKSGKTTLIVALARKIGLSLVYLRAIDLLNPNLDPAETIIQQSFKRARLTQPAVIVVDNYEQLLNNDTAIDSNHILGFLQFEVSQLSPSSAISVIVLSNQSVSEQTQLVTHALFQHILTIKPLSIAEIGQIIQYRLQAHVTESNIIADLAGRLSLKLHTVGEVITICEHILRVMLRENINNTYIAQNHIQQTLSQFGTNVGD